MRRTTRWARGAAVIAAVGVIAAGCGGDDDSPAASDGGSVSAPASDAPDGSTGGPASTDTSTGDDGETPVAGGSFTYITPVGIPSMDPVTFASPASAGPQIYGVRAFAVYDALVWENWKTGEVEYRLAESIESTDGIEWTMKIRPDVSFSDGTPFDAAAVKFHIERVQDPDNQSPLLSVAQRITSMEVVDPLTLVFTLAKADGQFPRTIANYFPFVGSPTAIEAKGAAFGNEPVGAGAFVMDPWEPSSDTMVMHRNPDYFGDPAYLDELKITVILDGEQALNTVSTGGADMMSTIDPSLAARAADSGLEFDTVGVTSGGRDLVFNTSKPPFDDVRARRAVAMAIDTQQLLDTLYGGERGPEYTMFEEGTPFHDAALEQVKHDADAAQELLDELAAEGKPLSFTLSLSDTLQTYGELIQAQLGAFDNLDVQLDIGVSLPFNTNVVQGNYQMAIYGHAFIDPTPVLDSLLTTGSTTNIMRYSNAEMDSLIATGQSTLDDGERLDAYRKVQELWIEEVPMVFINRASTDLIHTTNVHGIDSFGTGTPRWDLIWKDAS